MSEVAVVGSGAWDRLGLGMAVATVSLAAVRALSVPRWLQDLDGVDFARSLERYDLTTYAPHFPGYPVYVAAAKLASWAGAPDVLALSLPGLVLTALATVVLAVAGRRWFGEVGGWAAGLLWLVHPFVGLAAMRPGSDGAGASLVALGVGLALIGAREAGRVERGALGALAGVSLAAALGVRPSLVPLVLPLLVASMVASGGARRALVAGFVGGMAGWLVPWGVGFGDQVVATTAPFLEGHFWAWGGGVGASEASLGARLGRLGMWGWTAGLGGAWAGRGPWLAVSSMATVVAAAGAVWGALGDWEGRRWVVGLVVAAAVYGVWVWLFQNVDKPRHLLPLVPLVVLGLAGGAARLWAARGRWRPAVAVGGAAALACLGAEQVRVCRTLSMAPPPAVMAMEVVDREVGPEVMVVLGEEARLWNHYAPHLRAQRFGTLREALDRLDDARMRPPVLVVSSHVRGVAELVARGEIEASEVGRFERDPWAGVHYSAVRLYHVRRLTHGRAASTRREGGR